MRSKIPNLGRSITAFMIFGNLCFFLLLCELAEGPLYIVSHAWLICSVFIGGGVVAVLFFLFRNVSIRIDRGVSAALALWFVLVLAGFIFAPAIAYTALFGSKFESYIYVPETISSHPDSYFGRRSGVYFDAGNPGDTSSPCYVIQSPYLKRSFWERLCIRSDSFRLLPFSAFIKVDGRRSFFGKTVSEIRTTSDSKFHAQMMKRLPELNEFWETE